MVAEFPHASNNSIHRDGDRVVKRFVGPRAQERCSAERLAVTSLRAQLPVPELLSCDEVSMTTRFVPGDNGRIGLSDGHAEDILRLAGSTLRRLQAVPAHTVFDGARDTLG